MSQRIQLRFNNIDNASDLLWAYRCIENWIAQHDPKKGDICGFRQGAKVGSARRTLRGVTFTREQWL